MNKSLIILRREYLTRIKKKSFIIMTILIPFLMIGFIALTTWLETRESTNERTIAVYDEAEIFESKIAGSEYTHIQFIEKEKFELAKNDISNIPFYALLHLPADIMESSNAGLYSKTQVAMDVEIMVRQIGRAHV